MGKYLLTTSLEILVKVALKNKVVQMKIKLGSGKYLVQSLPKWWKTSFLMHKWLIYYLFKIEISV
jgi:hypothetical protein